MCFLIFFFSFFAKVFERMLQHGVQPNVRSFTRMVQACQVANKHEQVIRWVEDLTKRGLPWNLHLRSAVQRSVHALRARNRGDEAAALESMMPEADAIRREEEPEEEEPQPVATAATHHGPQ